MDHSYACCKTTPRPYNVLYRPLTHIILLCDSLVVFFQLFLGGLLDTHSFGSQFAPVMHALPKSQHFLLVNLASLLFHVVNPILVISLA